MGGMIQTPNASRRWTLVALLLLAACSLAVPPASALGTGSALYYKIGGAGPISASAGRGYLPGNFGLGIRWNAGSPCSGLAPSLTIANQLNGVTRGFQNLMSTVISSATGAVMALPAMIIQRAAPGLYDLLSNGILQGRLDFNRAKASCRALAKQAADAITAGGWLQQAQAENWETTAARNSDAVASALSVDSQGGDNGVTWVGARKRGGASQAPIRVTHDTAVAGYNLLHGRTNPTSMQPVPGGGLGWGSVPSAAGPWAGGGSGGGGGGCNGGMCTVWGSPAEAADWIAKVVGEREIRTCSGCEKVKSKPGTGLMRTLEDEQSHIETRLTALVAGRVPLDPAHLRKVSAGATLSVSAPVIQALRQDPQQRLLTHRLASEMALARTLTQALWARRILLAGADEPGIANNQDGQAAIDAKLAHLDRGIEALRTELEIRKALAHNAAATILARREARDLSHAPSTTQAANPVLDSRDPNHGLH